MMARTGPSRVLSGAGAIDAPSYPAWYRQSIEDPDSFWGEHGRQVAWFRPYAKVRDVSYGGDDVHIAWFYDGTLNVAYNCLDRHLETRGDQVAIIWEGDGPGETRWITYRELHQKVCRLANGLKLLGIGRGDRVAIYLPMVPEAAIAMLACARIGAVQVVMGTGRSADGLADSIRDCGARLLVTADEAVRGGRRIPLKRNADAALATCPSIEWCLVVRRTGAEVPWRDCRDKRYEDVIASASVHCPPAEMAAEEPLFILYTLGSTARPQGMVHSMGGYLVACATNHRHVLDYHDNDIYWCTADIGCIAGHCYTVYGPLANGATTLIFEGVPDYPTDSRIWNVVGKHRVNLLYTTPTAVRALMRHDARPMRKTSRQSPRILGTVGDAINPEAWPWYCEVVEGWRCAVTDTRWQPEVALLPGATGLEPIPATRPFFGVQPVVVDDQGRELEGACQGYLCLRDGGPGMMRTVYGDHEHFVQAYFATFPGLYFTGDGCRRGQDGYYEITRCVDDVMDGSVHRLVTAEIESALVAHPQVAEAAVVGCPHDLKGQGICAYVTLRVGEQPSEQLRRELALWVRQEIGPIAAPDLIRWAPALPKTRSGKIMRRILRNIASRDLTGLSDASTLMDPGAVGELVATRQAANGRPNETTRGGNP